MSIPLSVYLDHIYDSKAECCKAVVVNMWHTVTLKIADAYFSRLFFFCSLNIRVILFTLFVVTCFK